MARAAGSPAAGSRAAGTPAVGSPAANPPGCAAPASRISRLPRPRGPEYAEFPIVSCLERWLDMRVSHHRPNHRIGGFSHDLSDSSDELGERSGRENFVPVVARLSRRTRHGNAGHGNPERSLIIAARRHLDASAVRFDDLIHDVQTETQALTA